MKLEEMLEILRVTHPNENNQNLIKMLNKASDDFCRKTEVLDSSYTFSTVADVRYYDLLKSIVRVSSVDVDDESADKLVGRPQERDIS
tara:strand:+ start:3997 stop:4260 length:264 start_codon:yes stop_codon:yes gene_type:complete